MKGLIESTTVNLAFLEKYKDLLSPAEYLIAKKNTCMHLSRRLLKSILMFRFNETKAILKIIQWDMPCLLSIFYKKSKQYTIASAIQPAHKQHVNKQP
jgi:hypothetical protein